MDFERFTYQNSPEPNMQLDTKLAFFIYRQSLAHELLNKIK
jgi:hypothetical protein